MFLRMDENVAHDTAPFGQRIPFLTFLPERVDGHSLQPLLNVQSLHLANKHFLPAKKQMLVDDQALRIPRRGGFGLYGVIREVDSNVVSCDETKCNLTEWNAGPVDLFNEP